MCRAKIVHRHVQTGVCIPLLIFAGSWPDCTGRQRQREHRRIEIRDSEWLRGCVCDCLSGGHGGGGQGDHRQGPREV
jgi:hypothetical protein